MQWDLSPVRPWEWSQIIAYDWVQAKLVQHAFNEEIDALRKQQCQPSASEYTTAEAASIEAMKARMG